MVIGWLPTKQPHSNILKGMVIFQVILILLCLLNVKPTFPTWLEFSPNGSTEHNKCLTS